MTRSHDESATHAVLSSLRATFVDVFKAGVGSSPLPAPPQVDELTRTPLDPLAFDQHMFDEQLLAGAMALAHQDHEMGSLFAAALTALRVLR